MAGLGRVLPPVDPLKAPSLGGERLPDVSHVTERPISDVPQLREPYVVAIPTSLLRGLRQRRKAKRQREEGAQPSNGAMAGPRDPQSSIGDTFQEHNAVEASHKPPLRKDTEWKPNHHAF